MRIGVNWTSPEAFPIIKRLFEHGHIDFCEILLDNFIHLRPESIKIAIGDKPLAFHIMWSRFLERDTNELRDLANVIRYWINHLNPIYVSDHIARFTVKEKYLPITLEVDYKKEKQTIFNKCSQWQDLLETKVYFENFPSAIKSSCDQPEFFESLISIANLGLLFDLSNAVVANLNCDAKLENWFHCIKQTKHFHIAGYRISDTKPPLAIDSHDTKISKISIEFFKKLIEIHAADFSLVVERDANIEYESWLNDINSLQREFNGTKPTKLLES